MSWLLGAYSDRRTYGTLAYSLLGLPLGIFSFVVVVTGFAMGIGMIITLIGIPILVATLLFVRTFAAMERRLAWSLLEATMPGRAPSRSASGGYFWQRLRALIAEKQTWRELGFVLLRLPLGIVGFTIAATLIGLMFGAFAQPIVVVAGGENQLGSWVIDTIPESFVYLPISLLFLIVGPRILLGWGEISGRIATHFLGQVDTEVIKAAVMATLARTGQSDAFGILDAAELRVGRGPFLTPTRVEAALLALESTGHVHVQRGRPTTLYSLSTDTILEKK